MATSLSRFSLFVFLILVLLASLCESYPEIVGQRSIHRTISASGGSNRSLLGIRRSNPNQVVECGELASKSKCSQRSNRCRWCRSEVLDDMCFSKPEAWRLPPQIFSCD